MFISIARALVVFLLVIVFMEFNCICGDKYTTSRSLAQHQLGCDDFKQADSSTGVVPDAFKKFQAKQERKKRKRAHVEVESEPVAGPSTEPVDTEMGDPELNIGSPPPLTSPVRSPEPEELGRGQRRKRPTWKILQLRPSPANPPEPPPAQSESEERPSPLPAPTIPMWTGIKSKPNSFGVYREYPTMPTHNPDDFVSIHELSNSGADPLQPPSQAPLSLPTSESSDNKPPYYPFKNSTIHGFMTWLWTGGPMKSLGEALRLLNFLKSDDFKKEELEGFDIHAETAKFDKLLEKGAPEAAGDDPLANTPRDGWRESSVKIQVPDGKPHAEEDIPMFEVPGLHHRSIVEVMKSVLSEFASRNFHYTPFKEYQKRGDEAEANRMFGEMCSSDAMIDAHIRLQQQPPEPGCTLERVVLAMMLWSDSTHLASFGTAALWPIYLFFGNLSKYIRGKPSTASCHHIAYIPKLPDTFFDFFTSLTGDGPTSEILTHCRRELMHAVWACLLDDDFMHAYEHGIVIVCPDGISRRFYPRIFTYSADYPEKVLLATIRSMGGCPCPRCLVPKEKIPEVGTKPDAKRRETGQRNYNDTHTSKITSARRHIYGFGGGVKSAPVERLLADQSLVPTENAFGKLAKFGHRLFDMLVPDFMHKFELGVWKAIFVHLLRILLAHGEGTVQELNRRYRAVPTFGRSTIRQFSENASALKKMAARNYEDLLQCAIPVFDGLLPAEHDEVVISLLFTLAEWHCLGKLRLHTDISLGWLNKCTTNLGQQLRQFQKYTCEAFQTKELPSEEAARSRRRTKKGSKGKSSADSSGPKIKKFNMILIKLHALGDYVRSIRLFGTSDSYSTQSGELEHRRVKKFYVRTNKNRAVRQMTRLERRERALLRRRRKQTPQSNASQAPSRSTVEGEGRGKKRQKISKRVGQRKARPVMSFDESEPLPFTPPEYHHHISPSRNFPMHIHNVIDGAPEDDPSIKDFYQKLLNHLYGRIERPDEADDGTVYPLEEIHRVAIENEKLYRHKVMRVNFTTYDKRQDQDSINPRNHGDVMTLSQNDADHPFEYARVIGIFHVEAGLLGGKTESREVLWVRRFRRDRSYRAGFVRKRLHRLEFLPSDDPNAFGFLNPDDVIRGAHIIPAFRYGKTPDLLDGESFGRPEGELEDYRYHYVNIFVDRDMYMRYAGGGVGHYRVNTADVDPAQPPEPASDYETEDTTLEPPEPVVRTAENANSDEQEGGEDSEETDEEEESEEEPEDSDEDLGAEDGEGAADDQEDEGGYAVL